MTPAQVAQLVEHFLGKEEVTGSIPVLCSIVAWYPKVFNYFGGVEDVKREIRTQ
jgi:hypothetical protein